MQAGQARLNSPPGLNWAGADLRQIKTNPKINYERWGRGKGDRKTDVVRQRSEVK